MNNESSSPRVRPRDFALLLLASRDLRPRQRARDQRADVLGLDLKRRILQHLADQDPEPADVSATLFQVIEQFGPPFGPTRAIATLIHEEWQVACASPAWIEQLLAEAVEPAKRERQTDG
jgi:hypothetical protein